MPHLFLLRWKKCRCLRNFPALLTPRVMNRPNLIRRMQIRTSIEKRQSTALMATHVMKSSLQNIVVWHMPWFWVPPLMRASQDIWKRGGARRVALTCRDRKLFSLMSGTMTCHFVNIQAVRKLGWRLECSDVCEIDTKTMRLSLRWSHFFSCWIAARFFLTACMLYISTIQRIYVECI